MYCALLSLKNDPLPSVFTGYALIFQRTIPKEGSGWLLVNL